MTAAGVPFLDVGATYRELRTEIDSALARVMESGWYLLGAELEQFEQEWATHCGSTLAAGVGSGLDALVLALRALDVGPGDEVIVPSNTYVATWFAVSAVGATIVPVEPDPVSFNLTGDAVASAITTRTAAILPVHLYGQASDVHGISEVASRSGLPVVYDAAQAHGARVDGDPVGSFGTMTAWSFYPGKNLGAFADGGAITSDDPALIARVKRLRNYGSEVKYFNLELGINSRLDEVQAAILRQKLVRLDDWNHRRSVIAQRYCDAFASLPLVSPVLADGHESAWHLFVVRSHERDRLAAFLSQRKVATVIHYPIPPHRQHAYRHLPPLHLPVADTLAAEVLSLPIGPHMTEEQVDRVCDAVHLATQR